MTLTLEEVEAKIAEYTELRRKLAKEGGTAAISTLFAPLWEFPGVTAAAWRQYTPYFNDGDPCTFSVHADEFPIWIDGERVESWEIPDSLPDVYVRPPMPDYYKRPDWQGRTHEGDWENYQRDEERKHAAWKANGWTEETLANLTDVLNEISQWLNAHEGFLFDIYGDHVEITVTPQGIETDEYVHD